MLGTIMLNNERLGAAEMTTRLRACFMAMALTVAFLQIVCPLDWKRKNKVPPGLCFADTEWNDDAVDTLFLKPI